MKSADLTSGNKPGNTLSYFLGGLKAFRPRPRTSCRRRLQQGHSDHTCWFNLTHCPDESIEMFDSNCTSLMVWSSVMSLRARTHAPPPPLPVVDVVLEATRSLSAFKYPPHPHPCVTAGLLLQKNMFTCGGLWVLRAVAPPVVPALLLHGVVIGVGPTDSWRRNSRKLLYLSQIFCFTEARRSNPTLNNKSRISNKGKMAN